MQRLTEREILTKFRADADKKRLEALERITAKNKSDISDLQDTEGSVAGLSDEERNIHRWGTIFHDTVSSARNYKGPLEVKSILGGNIQFWGSSLAGAPSGKLSLFKGGWQAIDGTTVPFETDILVEENTSFYVEGTMTLDIDTHTYSMAYVFKKVAGTFPAPSNLIEIWPCWYVPVVTIGEGEDEQIVIDVANVERWLSVVNVPGIS